MVDTAIKYRIDVHHHFGPPAWVAAMKGNKLLQPANTTWTPEKSLADLDRGGGAAAILSITNPGLYLGDRQQTTALRANATFGAKVVEIIRHVLDCSPRCRCQTWMHVKGDRLRLRSASCRWRRIHDQLWRHVVGQRSVQAGL